MTGNGDDPFQDLTKAIWEGLAWVNDLDQRTKALIAILMEDRERLSAALVLAADALETIRDGTPEGLTPETLARVTFTAMERLSIEAMEKLDRLTRL